MLRKIGLTVLLAAVAALAGAAQAAPEGGKPAGKDQVCVRGEGRAFVDRSQSLYLAKCEVGNAAFFTATQCGGPCEGRDVIRTVAFAASCCSADKAKAAGSCCSADKAKAAGSCCSADKAKAAGSCCSADKAKAAGKACGAGVACGEVGNAAFFRRASACCAAGQGKKAKAAATEHKH
jgi:hypothetical protein